jgi:hypothetical protein
LPTTTNLAELRPLNAAHVESQSPDQVSNYAGREAAEVVLPRPGCFGTGLEVVQGRGVRRCGCRSEDSRLRFDADHPSNNLKA